MNIINITEDDLNKMKVLFDDSYESIVYLQNNKVFKIFRRKDEYKNYAQYDTDILQNKRNKLEYLDTINLSENFIKAKELIFIDGQFRGYTMDFISFSTLDDFIFKNRKIKIALLKIVKQLIDEAHKHDIILGDLNTSNILINNDKVYICDLDNSTISQYKTDSFPKALTHEYLKILPLDKRLDLFLYDILVLYMFYHRIPMVILNKRIMADTSLRRNKELWDLYNQFLDFNNEQYTPPDFLEVIEKQKRFFLF